MNHFCTFSPPKGTRSHRKIQRRLALPLHKDDTQIVERLRFFGCHILRHFHPTFPPIFLSNCYTRVFSGVLGASRIFFLRITVNNLHFPQHFLHPPRLPPARPFVSQLASHWCLGNQHRHWLGYLPMIDITDVGHFHFCCLLWWFL